MKMTSLATGQTSPDNTGLMILPWVSLFPGELLPLYIFELRYRNMLASSLHENRMIGIAHSTDDTPCDPFASLGIIRACVTNPDGTLNLILQGISRVQLSNFTPDPYPAADYHILKDPKDSIEDHEDLHLRILSICNSKIIQGGHVPKQLEEYLSTLTEASAFADAVASAFVGNPLHRREIFLLRNIKSRLQLLLSCLETEPSPEIEEQ